MKKSDKFQKFDEFMQGYLTKNSEEVMLYLDTALEEYEEDRDIEALLAVIKQIAEVKGGITELAKKTNLSRQNLYKIFSCKTSPRFENLVKILNALGYTFAVKKVANA